MNLKKRYQYFLYEPNKKGKRFHKWKWHVKMTKKGKILPIWKCHLTITKKHAYISIEWQLQTLFLTFIHKNKPLLSATSTPSCSPMAYNILLPWKILFVPTMWTLGNANTGLDSFFWFQNHSNYLDVKLKVSIEYDNKEFRLVQNLTQEEANFSQFMQLRIQLVSAAEKLPREENFSSVVTPKLAKDTDEQLKFSHGGWRSGPSKQKDLCESAAVQCGQARVFLCSNLGLCKEEGGWEVSTNCQGEF